METRKLGKILMVLCVIAICLISFVGILVSKQGQMKNVLPEYRLGMNLTGGRVSKFKISEKTEDTIYDAEGKVTNEGTNEDGSLKEGYRKETKPVNAEDCLNIDNYQKAKKVMENRLKSMGISEYLVKLNEQTGEMLIEIPEDMKTDQTLSSLTYVGKFEIKDNDTKEVLLDNKDVKRASVVYGSTSSGTAVYLSVEFGKEGKQKLEDITKTYISKTDEEGNTVTKNVSIELDGDSLITTYFGETISTGILQLSIGTASTSNEQITTYIEQASRVAGLVDSGAMPIVYELEENNFISNKDNMVIVKAIMMVLFVTVMIGLIYWIVKYKMNGLFAAISYIGLLAIVLLVLRYANVVIAFEALVAVISIFVANYAVLQYILGKLQKTQETKEEIIKETYKHFASIFAPLFILGIVFTFVSWLPIASIGMILFWGLTALAIYDYMSMKFLFDEVEK
ncbi:MAG: hypothetical protein HFJ26_04815 [Clostridia bacterium]|nr:hypothetical protein [Clostridia bacterium]